MDFKRQSFSEKKLSEINPETDIAVSITGRVIDIKQNMIIIDDGSSKASAYFSNENAIKNLKINDIIKLFGYVMPKPEGFDIKGDFVQDMNSLDIGLYDRINELEKTTD